MESIFILCGGYEWKNEKQMNRISNLIQENYEKPKILDVWFAQENDEYKKYDDIFVEIYRNNKILYERKIATQKDFIKECKWADVINIHGGSTSLLLSTMQKYDLKGLFQNKIVIGSSAGAIFLSSYSPNWNGKGMRKGGQILPLNVIVHYGDNEYLEDNANWSDLVEATTYSSVGISVILKEEDIRAFDIKCKEVIF